MEIEKKDRRYWQIWQVAGWYSKLQKNNMKITGKVNSSANYWKWKGTYKK